MVTVGVATVEIIVSGTIIINEVFRISEHTILAVHNEVFHFGRHFLFHTAHGTKNVL